MLNLKKQSETIQLGEIDLGTCPICHSYVSHIYFMQDKESKKQSRWYSCSCGVVWNTHKPTMIYDKKYIERFDPHNNKLAPTYEYPVHIYSPLIEELLYNRRCLLIGKQTAHQEDALLKRGWVAESIDKNEASKPTFCGDFETYEFKEGTKFGMIWAYHTLECFTDPIASFQKMRDLLTEDGILYLASPDTDFIHTRGSSCFRHWKPEMNYLMWNRRAITRQLENLGFNIIMARQNCWMRFPETDDFHIVAQKKFF